MKTLVLAISGALIGGTAFAFLLAFVANVIVYESSNSARITVIGAAISIGVALFIGIWGSLTQREFRRSQFDEKNAMIVAYRIVFNNVPIPQLNNLPRILELECLKARLDIRAAARLQDAADDTQKANFGGECGELIREIRRINSQLAEEVEREFRQSFPKLARFIPS